MYGFIRLLLGILLFLVLLSLIKKYRKLSKKMWCIIALSVSVIFSSVLNFFPLENAFLTFDSPIKAYHYSTSFFSTPSLTVQGENSEFMVTNENGKYKCLIIPREDNGWKVGVSSNLIMVSEKTVDSADLTLFQYRDTMDYYVVVSYVDGGHAYVSDSNQSNFSYLENQTPYKLYVTYFAYVPNITDDYCVYVNGQAISFDL